jgi:branched-chain amino acid transport system permease protein
MEIIPQLVANSIIAGAIYAMIALGWNLIFSTVKFFDLGYGALMAVGGYSTFYFSRFLGVGLLASIMVGVVVAGLCGYLLNRFIYSRLTRRKASTMVLLVASLGVLTALQALIAMIFTSQFQTLSREVGRTRVYDILGGAVTEVQLAIIILSVVVMIGLAIVLRYTRFGRAVRAIGDDREVAEVVASSFSSVLLSQVSRAYFLDLIQA